MAFTSSFQKPPAIVHYSLHACINPPAVRYRVMQLLPWSQHSYSTVALLSTFRCMDNRFSIFQSQVHIAHCNHSCDFSIRTAEPYAWLHYWNSHDTPLFQYCNHVSDCSVQCAIGTENSEATVQWCTAPSGHWMAVYVWSHCLCIP